MLALQLGCTAIVLLYLFLRLWHEPARLAFLGRFALFMSASWIAENTCIRAYGFYAYSPEWFGFIDQVPILIVAIWPVVIHSVWDLATARGGPIPRRAVIIAGLTVLTDAALIEPIAVKADLWQWFEPGLFEVPPIGIIGWAIFATLSMFVLRSRLHPAWLLLIAPAGTHLLLLASWWGALRHVSAPIPSWAATAVALAVSAAVCVHLLRSRGLAPSLSTIMLRAPGAGFFFVLLAIHATDDPLLMAYALAFALPWLLFIRASARTRRVAIAG